MTDSATDRPAYGHFGSLTYDTEDRTWHSQRQIRDVRVWCATGTSLSTAVDQDAHPNTRKTPGLARNKQVDDLVKSYPEFQPCAELLPELAQASEAVEKHAAIYDPNKGSLLALGRIFDEANHRHGNVVAFATALTGSDLRIVEIQPVKRGWEDSKSAYVEIPTAIGKEATWEGPGVPIQQLVFAQPNEHGYSLLAVRLMTSTVIIRPTLRSFSSPHGSRLRIDFVQEISIEDTGGVPHIDVAFNPWFTRQLAVVDSQGQWSVWELQNPRKWLLHRQEHGRHLSLKSDGATNLEWAHITWVANASILAVCNRQRLGFLKLSTNQSKAGGEVEVTNDKDLGWILDIATLSNRPSLLLVLTSMRVVVYSIDENSAGGVNVHSTTTISHALDPGDITLSLHAFDIGDGESNWLKSRYSY